MWKYKERQTLTRFLCKVSSTLKVPKFPMTTALQHCLNHLVTPLWVGSGLGTSRPTIAATTTGIAPSMTVSLFYGFRSFHLQFHDSQIISPCLDSLLVGEMGVVRDNLAAVD